MFHMRGCKFAILRYVIWFSICIFLFQKLWKKKIQYLSHKCAYIVVRQIQFEIFPFKMADTMPAIYKYKYPG